MEKIYVYADFDFLKQTELVGELSYERVRGNDHFSFEFTRDWLKRHGNIVLGGDVKNVLGLQHPRQGSAVFGFVKDSFPDRWGRLLLDRRERMAAQSERRAVRALSNYDYLVGIEDLTRMGGIRYSKEKNGVFVNAESQYSVPPMENLRTLCDACREVETAEEQGILPQQRWLDQLVNPGSSLGGARPKANVMDGEGKLYVAKFPSKKDLEDTELIEHFSHIMAREAGVDVARTCVIPIAKDRHVLLSQRFDRTEDGKRRHFASAMSLLGLDDGCGADTGNGYLDMVDFIVQGCTDIHKNLLELYRRVAFNILFGNTDDHFRNHGFLLTQKGWTLAPAYDINPTTSMHQCLLVNGLTENSDVNVLLDSCESYMLLRDEAATIIEEVIRVVKSWRRIAMQNKIPIRVLEPYRGRWDV